MEVKYYKIRADFKFANRGRFYRTFLVREDFNLDELGEFMVVIFGGSMEHLFMYRIKGMDLIPSSWVGDLESPERNSYKENTVKDLPERFIFEYDMGDGWDFDCRIYKKTVIKTFDDNENIAAGFVLDAKGMGIWEDNIGTLYAYLAGEIDENFDGEDEERGIYKPWNFDINKYSEFDDPVDIATLNDEAMRFQPTPGLERY